ARQHKKRMSEVLCPSGDRERLFGRLAQGDQRSRAAASRRRGLGGFKRGGKGRYSTASAPGEERGKWQVEGKPQTRGVTRVLQSPRSDHNFFGGAKPALDGAVHVALPFDARVLASEVDARERPRQQAALRRRE